MGSPQEERTFKSSCGMCFKKCSLLVHVVNGQVVKVERDPDFPTGHSKLCDSAQNLENHFLINNTWVDIFDFPRFTLRN
jgi:anaerobic selenocysteine-containing dehydrogenase